jgi:hypothetical protein
MKVRLTLLSVAVVVAAIAVACGDSEETAYLESVSEAFDLFSANLEEFNTLFGQAWPLPSLLFMALEEAGAGEALDSTLVALEKMEPPKRFTADHALLVAGVREARIADQVIGQAVADVDILSFSLGNMSLGQKQGEMRLSLSEALCNAAEPSEGDKHDSICERPRPDDGNYGEEVFALMSELQIELVPRARLEIPAFAFDLAEDIFSAITPEVVRVLESAISTAADMEPPQEFEDDHQRLVEYLEEQLELVPQEPVLGVREGPPEGLPPGLVSYCDTREAFMKEYARLVVVHFGDDEDMCNPDRTPPP